MIPQEYRDQVEDWADRTEIDGAVLEEVLVQIFDVAKIKYPDVPDEDLWEAAKDKLYTTEVRDILRSNAQIFTQMFIGVSQLQDRNRFRRQDALAAKREDFDDAVDAGWINEDGKPIRADGRILQEWLSRTYLALSMKKEERDADPENPVWNFFVGSMSGKIAGGLGKKKPEKGIDLNLRPKSGHWYQVRWLEAKDEHPQEMDQPDGEKILFRVLGRSAKVTNFAWTEKVSEEGLEALKSIAEGFPDDLIIPIPKKEIEEWFATHVVVDTDEEGKPILDWNAFGLIKGKLVEVVQATHFASITIKCLTSEDEIRVNMDPYTLNQIIEGVGIGSIIGAFAMPYKRRKTDTMPSFYEARGLGLAVLKLSLPIDLDAEEDEEDDDAEGGILEV